MHFVTYNRVIGNKNQLNESKNSSDSLLKNLETVNSKNRSWMLQDPKTQLEFNMDYSLGRVPQAVARDERGVSYLATRVADGREFAVKIVRAGDNRRLSFFSRSDAKLFIQKLAIQRVKSINPVVHDIYSWSEQVDVGTTKVYEDVYAIIMDLPQQLTGQTSPAPGQEGGTATASLQTLTTLGNNNNNSSIANNNSSIVALTRANRGPQHWSQNSFQNSIVKSLSTARLLMNQQHVLHKNLVSRNVHFNESELKKRRAKPLKTLPASETLSLSVSQVNLQELLVGKRISDYGIGYSHLLTLITQKKQ